MMILVMTMRRRRRKKRNKKDLNLPSLVNRFMKGTPNASDACAARLGRIARDGAQLDPSLQDVAGAGVA